jgi:hypothetical protein
MPRLLAERMAADCVQEFLAAARHRDREAWLLAMSGHRTGAIYLWGYVAEMTLKAAWFTLYGLTKRDLISKNDLRQARLLGMQAYNIHWKGALHDLECWALLLTQHRAALGRPYPIPGFSADVVYHSCRVYGRWRETLRYRKNQAYEYEVRAVAQSAGWLLSNASKL